MKERKKLNEDAFSLSQSILGNEKIMDNLAKIYVETLNSYYGNGRQGNDSMAKKDMVYYLEQNCGVCMTPSSISSQLTKIWGEIQKAARKYGYSGPIMSPKPEGLPSYLQQIAEKVLADEKVMESLGASCYYATTRKGLVKGAMMSKSYWGSYPNELLEWVRSRNWGYLSFNEAKEIIRFIKKDIAKRARLYAKENEQNDMASLKESQLVSLVKESVENILKEMDELSPKLLQKAADKAWDMNRWSQHDAFEDEAVARAQAEFGENNSVRIVTPKKISYEAPDGGFCVIFRDGTYSYRPRNGYNNETGNLSGGNEFPKYMRVPDKRVARSLVRWWKTYNECEAPVPFMEDWHNLLQW